MMSNQASFVKLNRSNRLETFSILPFSLNSLPWHARNLSKARIRQGINQTATDVELEHSQINHRFNLIPLLTIDIEYPGN